MTLRKMIILGLIILLLTSLFLVFLIGYRNNNMLPEKALDNFSKIIEKGNLNGISLTIYYAHPFAAFTWGLNVDDLMANHDYKIVANGNDLQKNIDILNQISSDVLIPVDIDVSESYLDAQIYYVFEKKGQKIFDVAMWVWGPQSDYCNILINGVQFKENDIFYDVIIPFLPEDAAKHWGGEKEKTAVQEGE